MSSAAPYRYINAEIHERRERVFLILAGTFLGMMIMLNILGITKFIQLGPFALAVGVLPYPLTFLCTDFISEFYGRRRANTLVWIGFGLNLVVLAFLWAGNALPSIPYKTDLQRLTVVDYETIYDDTTFPPSPLEDPRTGLALQRPVVDVNGEKVIIESVRTEPIVDPDTGEPVLDPDTGRPVVRIVESTTGQSIVREDGLLGRIFLTTQAAVLASMVAYLVAQLVDVRLFHFWKRLTNGKHLWLRNNGSTLVSQLVDTTAVVLITFWASILSGEMGLEVILSFIGSGYLFKMLVAMADTVPFYIGSRYLKDYLQIDPMQEHDIDDEETLEPRAAS
jgi:uncharacterized PurR-regulated membrane protein YhhQ (DUF165 family)